MVNSRLDSPEIWGLTLAILVTSYLPALIGVCACFCILPCMICASGGSKMNFFNKA